MLQYIYVSLLQEQKSFTEKSSKALQDKEKELQKAVKDAKVPSLLHPHDSLCHSIQTAHRMVQQMACL